MTRILPLAVVVATLALSYPAQAAPRREGTVMAIDSGDLVVDLGASSDAREGQVVELWRPIRVRHPVTGQVIVDRFRIGRLRLVQVQNQLSLARAEGDVSRPPAAGDVVVVPSEPKPSAEAPVLVPPTSTAPVTIVYDGDPDAKALGELFASLGGIDPEGRIAAYRAFVSANPKSRFGAVLREEMIALRPHTKEEAPFTVSPPKLDRVKPGTPQSFAVELDPRFVGAVLHVRRTGDRAYRSIPMKGDGARYWSATLPGDAIQDPGMQYFVEGVVASGAPVAMVGTADAPRDVAVDPHPTTGRPSGSIVQASLASEYASFDVRNAKDYLWQTEGSFGWRLGDTGIRAVRSGFGVLRGSGGTLHDLDDLGLPAKGVGLTYGWIETELAWSPRYAVLLRPIIGLRDGGLAGGAQSFLRVGNDLGTNLLVGGEVIGTIGLRGIIELDLRAIRRVPIVMRTEVTNQPAGVGSDVGVRAIAQVGYELTPSISISARGSYQGRTIRHAGPGAGLALGYQW